MTNTPKFTAGDAVIFTLDDGKERRGYFDSETPFSGRYIIRATKSKKSGIWLVESKNVRHAK